MQAPHAAPRRPLVIAHRGASGYLPEHTLEAYRLAIAQGADFIEPDLVATADGELVARHENELSGTTDVAMHGEFAARRTSKCMDGEWVSGWFSEDFTLQELRRLRARERLPLLRPDSARHDGLYGIPSLRDILALVREAEREGRRVGIYPETKRPTWFAHEGTHADGRPIGISLGERLVAILVEEGFTDPDRVFIQSFEVANLLELAGRILPAAGVRFPLVQLLGDTGAPSVPLTGHPPGPWDVAWHRARGETAQVYGRDAPRCLSAAHTSYADLAQDPVLRWMRARYASAIGPWKQSLLPRLPLAPAELAMRSDAASARLAPTPTSSLAERARDAGLSVHAYTLRAEPPFLAIREDGSVEPVEEEAMRLFALGVDGIFIDQPDRGVAARARWCAGQARPGARS